MRAMKDSGIEWIGQIPQAWSVGKTIFGLEMPITDGPHETPQLYSEGIPFVSAEAVSTGNGRINFENIRGYISQEYYEECCKKYIPQKEDIYMIKSGATTGKIAIVDTDDVFTIWSPLAVFRCNKERCISRFLFYTLQSDYYQKQLESKWSFGTQQNIGMRTLERLLICYPAVPEQERIVDYLDAKCAAIDALIAAKEKTNALLKERRQSIIYEAVTKGLNPDAPMKDSGIEWIGQIPECWDVAALKRVATPSTGMTPSKANPQFWEGDIPWFSSKDIKADYLFDSEDHISQQAVEECGLTVHAENSVVFCARSGILRHTFPVSVLKCKGTINQDLRVLATSAAIDPEFLMYYLRGMNNTIVTLYQKVGATVESIEMEWLLYLPVALPPVEEQKQIADYIVARCNEIDGQIAANEVSVTKLKEYRQSIIYEAVTGKIEV